MIFFSSLFTAILFCQDQETRILEGILIGDGEPIIGVMIHLVGDIEQGTVTDADGSFRLEIPNEEGVSIHVELGVCSKHPKNIIIGKYDRRVKLKLKNCEIRKKRWLPVRH